MNTNTAISSQASSGQNPKSTLTNDLGLSNTNAKGNLTIASSAKLAAIGGTVGLALAVVYSSLS